MTNNELTDALQFLRPKAQWFLNDSGLVWLDTVQTQPRWAARPILADITIAQVKTAVINKINSGDSD